MADFGVGIVGEYSCEKIVEIARLCEKLGYNNLWHSDEKFYKDVYVNLTLCALNTTKIKLGTCITDPYSRHPALTAVAIATLDEVSKRRAVLGMGAGVSGLATMGIKRQSPAVAIKEAIKVIRDLLSGKTVNFDGKIIKFKGGKLNFKARSNIPIYVAARGPKILEVGGEIADGVIIGSFASKEGLNYALDRIKTGVMKAGKKMEGVYKVSWVYCSISEDEKEAKQAVKRGVAVALWGSMPILDKIGIKKYMPQPLLEYMEKTSYSLSEDVITKAMKLLPDKIVDKFSIAGTSEECMKKVDEIFRLGIKQIAIWPFPRPNEDVIDVIKTFANEVIPHFEDRSFDL